MTAFKNGIKKYFWYLFVLPFLLSYTLIAFSKKEDLVIFPNPQETQVMYRADTYSDKEDGGTSTITKLQFGDTKCSYNYTLGNGIESPYAGVAFTFSNPTDSLPYIDVSAYTDLFITLTIRGTATQDIYLKTFSDSISSFHDRNSYGFARAQVSHTTGTFSVTIPLSDFNTPDWWYANHSLTADIGPQRNLKKLLELNIQNSVADHKVEEPISITISDIRFTYSPRGLYLPLFLGTLTYILLLILLRFKLIHLGKSEDPIVITYNKVELSDDKHSEDVARITAYIAENYADAGLTVDILAKGAGVSAAKVPTMLKHKFQMNFKQYLNTIRITEAKRLLLETDQQIVTIAQSVGYNNIPHFNRTFKQLTGLSPKQFRQNPDEATPLHVPGTAHHDEENS